MSEFSGINSLEPKLKEFVSIHVHKSGGTTFGFILKDIYGNDMLWDKSDGTSAGIHGRSIEYDQRKVEKATCIHGHMSYDKYKYLNRPYITWIRHPITRLESEYSVVRQKPQFHIKSLLHHRVVNEGLDFIGYCEAHHNVYSNYFGNMEVDDFAFIGIVEYYERSLFLFSQLIGKEIPMYCNRNQRKRKRGQIFKEATPQERVICSKLNMKDIEFYERAKRRLLNELESSLSLYVPGKCAARTKREMGYR